MQEKYDITNQKFGRLLVLERDTSTTDKRNSKWICRCDCGNIVSVARCSLVSGHSKSCGCTHFETHNQTHGMSKTHIFKLWFAMKRRCNPKTQTKKNKCYKGISVCDEWESDFMSFYTWSMANGCKEGLSIDRIDNSKGYSPSNCRWIPIAEQQRNKTNNVKIMYEGKEVLLIELCRKLNFPYKKAHRRYSVLKNKNAEISAEKIFF